MALTISTTDNPLRASFRQLVPTTTPDKNGFKCELHTQNSVKQLSHSFFSFLLISLVLVIFSSFFYFGSCGGLSWLICQLSSAR